MSFDGASVASLTEVSHRYRGRPALLDVSLEVPAGCTVGFIGPDGVGKSSLLALIAGVKRRQEGRIWTLGGDMSRAKHRRNVLGRLAYMPQGLGQSLYPSLSVRENVDFFGRLFGHDAAERRERIEALLQSTGLTAFAERPAGKLSGGMKQKLSLCCALIHDPDLLILDEPTTGIDPLSRRQFWALIDAIKERRPSMSVLAATADMDEAERFDHLVALNAGRVLASGSAQDLKSSTGTQSLEQAFLALLPEEERSRPQASEPASLPETAGTPAIEALGLTKVFGDFTAVDQVTLSIARGEIFGFLGSNGCGKTTTMKMLTGLLPPTAGSARLFGHEVDARDLETRRRVGYMSQSFSLYGELSVRQNLNLHAKLFQIPAGEATVRITELLDRFKLESVADFLPSALPLGVRQRLQLAVAVIHRPEMLILDEPTSGVDLVAREEFWALLVDLSRNDGVTIFISTHFLQEAERCDRVSFMHAGKLLAVGTPGDLRAAQEADTLEEAFIGYLEALEPDNRTASRPFVADADHKAEPRALAFDPSRFWAFARRESVEVIRDPIRLAFALINPIILMLAMCFGISFDIEEVPFAALDQDQTRESRAFLEFLGGSRYLAEHPPFTSEAELDRRLVEGDIKAALILPPDFGRDLLAGRQPEIAVWLEGSDTYRAETARGYLQAVQQDFLAALAEDRRVAQAQAPPAESAVRFRYNQTFASVNAIAPGAIMMMLIMTPAMLTALGVVREKELGSIANFYAAPVSKLEFLIGKQAPYIVIAFVSFLLLFVVMRLGLGVVSAGSFLALSLGALCFVMAATAFGLVMSTLVRSQIAAIFGTAIVTMTPTVNFSGMLYPTASLEGGARVISAAFPSTYFQSIASGVVNKGLDMSLLYPDHLMLLGMTAGLWFLAALLLRKQAP